MKVSSSRGVTPYSPELVSMSRMSLEAEVAHIFTLPTSAYGTVKRAIPGSLKLDHMEMARSLLTILWMEFSGILYFRKIDQLASSASSVMA